MRCRWGGRRQEPTQEGAAGRLVLAERLRAAANVAERYLGLPVEEQADLQAAFERSALSGLRAAERLHVEVRLRPEAELGAAYRTEPV